MNVVLDMTLAANLPFSLQLKQLMIVGIDCYHDISAGRRSIGALVASLNQSMSRYVSTDKPLKSFYIVLLSRS